MEEWFKTKCPSCVNYQYKQNGEYCGKFKDKQCKNYRKYLDSIDDTKRK